MSVAVVYGDNVNVPHISLRVDEEVFRVVFDAQFSDSESCCPVESLKTWLIVSDADKPCLFQDFRAVRCASFPCVSIAFGVIILS